MSEGIPEGWINGQFGTVAQIEMGQSPPGGTYNDRQKGIPLINGPTEFTERYPIKRQWTTKPTKKCFPGDILLCVRGSSTGRINISNDEYCIGRGLAAIRANGSNHSTQYVEHLLYHLTQIILSQTAGSTFPNIDKTSLSELSVLIPPFRQQQKIASILTSVDEVIEKTEAQISKLQDLKKGMMQELLTKSIGHTEFKDSPVGRTPKEWEVASIGDLSGFVTSGSRGWGSAFFGGEDTIMTKITLALIALAFLTTPKAAGESVFDSFDENIEGGCKTGSSAGVYGISNNGLIEYRFWDKRDPLTISLLVGPESGTIIMSRLMQNKPAFFKDDLVLNKDGQTLARSKTGRLKLCKELIILLINYGYLQK